MPNAWAVSAIGTSSLTTESTDDEPTTTTTLATTTTTLATTTTTTTTAVSSSHQVVTLPDIQNFDVEAVFYRKNDTRTDKDGDRLLQVWGVYTSHSKPKSTSATITESSTASTQITLNMPKYTFFTNVLEVPAKDYASIMSKFEDGSIQWGDLSGFKSWDDYPQHIQDNGLSGTFTAASKDSLNDVNVTFDFKNVLEAQGEFTVGGINFSETKTGEGYPTAGENGFYVFSVNSNELAVLPDNKNNRDLAEKMFEQWSEPMTSKTSYWVIGGFSIGLFVLGVILFTIGCCWSSKYNDMKETFSS